MREHRIAVIPGDGIGTEVIPAGVTVLRRLEQKYRDFHLHFEALPWGSNSLSDDGPVSAGGRARHPEAV